MNHKFANDRRAAVGVDDLDVTIYDQQLRDVYYERYTSEEDREAIKFRGLNDIFFSDPDITAKFKHEWIQNVDLPHPIETARSSEAELSRKMMMSASQTDREVFRKLVKDGEPHVTQLYRGQSRFMLEDISQQSFLSKSVSQRKKIACKVASEMIARNRAYSNLLELLVPNYIRLSIHA